MSLPVFKPLPKPRPLVILDFDCECRPLHWYGGDWVSKEITAIAWAVVNPRRPDKAKGKVRCVLLGEPISDEDLTWAPYIDPESETWTVPMMLEAFVEAYNAADMVTGHFIRGFDLPLVNGALLENGMPPLGPKLAHDTKGDLIRFQGLSKSQENLGGMLGLRHPKVQMNQTTWRAANQLLPEGIELARKRVVGDVRQHIEMRAVLIEREMLNPPKRWTGEAGAERYQP